MAARTHTPVSMEARQVDELPRGPGWQYEPKWDGFRCIARRNGKRVELLGRSGKSLARYLPEIVEALSKAAPHRFTLDGELVIPAGKALSFEALQMRLHPAESRIRRLSGETPAVLIAFDMLQAPDGSDLAAQPLRKRQGRCRRCLQHVEGNQHRRRLTGQAADAALCGMQTPDTGASKESALPAGMTSSPSSVNRSVFSLNKASTMREIACQALARAARQQLDPFCRCAWRCSESRPHLARTASPGRAAARRFARASIPGVWVQVRPSADNGPVEQQFRPVRQAAHASMSRGAPAERSSAETPLRRLVPGITAYD